MLSDECQFNALGKMALLRLVCIRIELKRNQARLPVISPDGGSVALTALAEALLHSILKVERYLTLKPVRFVCFVIQIMKTKKVY